MQLNSNKLPISLVILEGIFNSDDQLKKKMNLTAQKGDYKPIVVAEGRSLNLGKVCSSTKQEAFLKLCQRYDDIVAWTYEDLKGFDPSLSQHTIELNSDAKPVRQSKGQ